MTSVTLLVAGLGVFVTLMTLIGAFLVGLTEAADSDHARSTDLSELERSMVERGVADE